MSEVGSRLAINAAQAEINTLKMQIGNSFTPDGIERLRLELKNLQDRNMAEASFEERLDLVARLGIKAYPSEDLKSRRTKCGMDIRGIQKIGDQEGFAKVVYGRPNATTANPKIESFFELSLIPASPIGRQGYGNS